MGYLPDPAEESALASEQSHDRGTYAGFTRTDEAFVLTIDTDDPIHCHLVRLWELNDEDREERVAQTVVGDRDLAMTVAAEMAAAADELVAVDERPTPGPETVYQEDVERETLHPETPDEWADNGDDWEEALEDAFDEADIPRSKGTLTIKTIDGREYYYLQWREGDTVTSQYVAPVNPA